MSIGSLGNREDRVLQGNRALDDILATISAGAPERDAHPAFPGDPFLQLASTGILAIPVPQTDSLTLRSMAVDGLTGQAMGGWGPPAHAYAVCVSVVGRHGRVFVSP